nr:hypothetical protein Iba_chr01dCG4210 [Ipomoea batatas]
MERKKQHKCTALDTAGFNYLLRSNCFQN